MDKNDEAYFDLEFYADNQVAHTHLFEKQKTDEKRKAKMPVKPHKSLPEATTCKDEEPLFDVGTQIPSDQHHNTKKKESIPEIFGYTHVEVVKRPEGIVQLAKVITTLSGQAKTVPFSKSVLSPKKPIISTIFTKNIMNQEELHTPASKEQPQDKPLPVATRFSTLANPSEFKAFVFENLAETGCFGIALKGRFEHLHQSKFDAFLDVNLPTDGRLVILDLDGLISISSSGWGVLIAQLQRVKKNGGNIALCGMHGEVENCFKILELGALFPVFPTIIDALKNPGLMVSKYSNGKKSKVSSTAHQDADAPALLPLEDKIKRIIVENPVISLGEISRLLRSSLYGKIKIDNRTLREKLSAMNLGTKEERLRYFRSA